MGTSKALMEKGSKGAHLCSDPKWTSNEMNYVNVNYMGIGGLFY